MEGIIPAGGSVVVSSSSDVEEVIPAGGCVTVVELSSPLVSGVSEVVVAAIVSLVWLLLVMEAVEVLSDEVVDVVVESL